MTDCVVFLTHRWSTRIAAHYERLKREAGQVLDVVLVLQSDAGQPEPDGMAPDLIVSSDDTAALFPARHAEFRGRSSGSLWGYVDLLWLTVYLSPRLAAHDRFWLVEYDVDYSGNWGELFATLGAYEGDLLATRFRRLSAEIGWKHGATLNVPATAPADPLLALFSFSRLSRPLITAYRDAVLDPAWTGHFEGLLPSFAESAGFSIAEIGGTSAWTPPDRLNLHYRGDFGARAPIRTTWNYSPPFAFRYFAEAPQDFSRRDTLYHPVKTDLTLRRRLHFSEMRLRANWRALWGR